MHLFQDYTFDNTWGYGQVHIRVTYSYHSFQPIWEKFIFAFTGPAMSHVRKRMSNLGSFPNIFLYLDATVFYILKTSNLYSSVMVFNALCGTFYHLSVGVYIEIFHQHSSFVC